ncbi:PrpF domain-containing protein [Neisseria leonii]|uniref:PrpF domain-containing protein n=1 Tax=Neisseria leonii TaxID=2995413 RepID=A0A9X4E0T2_9NEIS|nr:PrpF domain-containing protein [Neisseria sp. 51.81]MDD9327410.1 hypothetical protein [Neisseria sp. 51.81]
MNELTINAVWMRGGTSKCWVFERAELERAPLPLDDVLLRAFGSPDKRQLDGVGGGTSTTSKAVILSPDEGGEYDVHYLFAQVGIDEPVVDWGSNCGNCSAVAALYALEKGWVAAQDGITTVRVYNENTGQAIVQQIATPRGRLPAADSPMAGCVYPGIAVNVGFEDPAGKTTGSLFPAGQPETVITVEGRPYTVTLVDAGAPCVYVDAASLGLAGQPRGQWTETVGDSLAALEAVRRQAAVLMGLADSPEAAARAVPKLGVIGSGGDGADLRVQMLSMGQLHPAMPVTGSVALTLSARYEGTVTARILGRTAPAGITLDTPSGHLQTFAADVSGLPVVGVSRTCRIMAQARIHVPLAPLPKEVAV